MAADKVITLQNGEGAGQPLKVHIPAGIDTGKKIRLKGKGHPGYGGGEAGDLYLKINVLPKPGFERKGMDVYTTAEIPFTTAALGGTIRGTHPLWGCGVQSKGGNAIRKQDPAEKQGNCFHEKCFPSRGSVCYHTDTGAQTFESRGQEETSGISGHLRIQTDNSLRGNFGPRMSIKEKQILWQQFEREEAVGKEAAGT